MGANTLGKSQRDELRDRVNAYRKRLEARVLELKADGSEKSRNTIKEIEERLGEVREHAKQGWENLSEEVAGRLNSCLKKFDK